MSAQDLTAEVEARLAVALPLVAAAGKLALEHFRVPIAVENKRGEGAFDPVTAADRGAEALIRVGLAGAYPDSPIQGEEEGFTPGTSDWSWIIDPIDGTRAFITGVPACGRRSSLGLLKDERPVAGIMYQPYLQEIFVGGPAGAVLRRPGSEIRLRTSGRTVIGEAVLYSTHPGMFGRKRCGGGSGRCRARCG